MNEKIDGIKQHINLKNIILILLFFLIAPFVLATIITIVLYPITFLFLLITGGMVGENFLTPLVFSAYIGFGLSFGKIPFATPYITQFIEWLGHLAKL